jgi:(1->4)-alpha-D-glucan 1-alpha-D-glucosylmutase
VAELVDAWPDERLKLFVTWRALDCRRQNPELFLQGTYEPLTAQGTREAHLCAFMRTQGSDWLLVAAPRFTVQAWSSPVSVETSAPARTATAAATLPQTNTAVTTVLSTWWEDTRLELPVGAPQQWQHVFTGEQFSAADHDGGLSLSLSELTARFPVVMLLGKA